MTREETEIAKNYLTEEELNILNRMVSAYLDIAEINVLASCYDNAGLISHEEALKKAHEEYDKYMQNRLTKAEKDYLEIMHIELKELEKNN